MSCRCLHIHPKIGWFGIFKCMCYDSPQVIFNPSSHGHFHEARNTFGHWFYLFILGNIILVYRERKEFTISKVYQDDLIEESNVGDVSKFINGETQSPGNHWWPSVISKWQGTKRDINRLGERRAPCFIESGFAEFLAMAQWGGWNSKRFQETLDTSMPEGWCRRTRLSTLHIHLRKPLKGWLLRPSKEMNNVTQPQLYTLP